MTTEERLKELILTKYQSIREFTITTGIAYSTFDTIMKRGVNHANISNVLKICNALHISADELANGNIVMIQETVAQEKTKDIMDILEETKNQLLTGDGLMFNGEVADQECIESIIDAMEIALEMVKRNKNKGKND